MFFTKTRGIFYDSFPDQNTLRMTGAKTVILSIIIVSTHICSSLVDYDQYMTI